MRMRTLIGVLLVAAVVCALSFVVFAQDEGIEEVKLYIGETKVLAASSPSRIVIGNPAIVDVVNVSKDAITLIPKAPGTTNLIFRDNFGEETFRINVYSENMNEAKRRIDNLLDKLELSNVYTQAEEEENKVVLLGSVTDAKDKERIDLVLGDLKEKTVDLIEVKEEEAVVEIDVEILELSQGATNTLGFSWPGSLTISTDQAVDTTSAGYSGTAVTKWSTFFDITKWSRTNFEFRLDALIQEGKAKILSRPRLACQSGKEAELLVGGEKPIITTQVASAGGEGTNVSYKEFGIKLNIKPTVVSDERLKLAVNVEVSDVGDYITLGSSTSPTAKATPLTKRSASTELFLSDGQTMAIGGLIKQKTEEELRKMPWLSDIPILGLFFKKKVTKTGSGFSTSGDTELFITLTPRIYRSAKAKETPKISEKALSSSAKYLSSDIGSYSMIIRNHIAENLVYPVQARESGYEGTVVLRLRISSDGKLLEVRVKESSGYKAFDDNALSVARATKSYPPFPATSGQKEVSLDVPVVYQLGD